MRQCLIAIPSLLFSLLFISNGAVAQKQVLPEQLTSKQLTAKQVSAKKIASFKKEQSSHKHEHSHSEKRGKRGHTGKIGEHGQQGRQGPQGEEGLHGVMGVVGIQGLPGVPGAPGVTGTVGISTYITDTATGSEDQQNVAPLQPIIFNSILAQGGPISRTAPGVYTVANPGVYEVTFAAYYLPNPTTAFAPIALAVNGVVVSQTQISANTPAQANNLDYLTMSAIIEAGLPNTTFSIVNASPTVTITIIDKGGTHLGSNAFITIQQID